jgi:hypothetical protein|tara:strand:+ start:181 stop:291 length:111 start_codon:yes stop_codon:yes gene_type:complete
MGFDPQRPHRRRPADLAYVAVGVVVGVLLLLWAFLG